MALSGNFTTGNNPTYTPYGGYFTFHWTATQSISGNYSDVTWWITRDGSSERVYTRWGLVNSTPYGTGFPGPNDEYYSPTNNDYGYIEPAQGATIIGPIVTRVYHSADGTGSFVGTVRGNIYTSYMGTWYNNKGNYNSYGSRVFELDTIPRNSATVTAVSLTNTKYTYSGTDYIVAGYSTTTFTPSVTMGDAPSIAKYRLWIGNTLVNEWTSTPLTFTVPLITSNTQSIAYKMSVIDSYGIESNKFDCAAFTAYKYTRGDATSDPLTQRCLQNGTLDEDGTYALCKISFSKSQIGTTQITTTITATINGASGTSTTSPTAIIVGGGNLLNNKSYEVAYKISDLITTTPVVIATDIVSVSFYTMHVTADGKGIAFGEAATTGFFDIDNMEFRVNEAISTSANHGKMAVGFLSGDNQNHGLYSYGYVDSNNQFVSDPMWLIKRDNTGAVTIAGGVETYSNLISRTSGLQRSSNTIKKSGNVVSATLVMSGDGADHYVGNNIFEGTMSSLRPATDVMGVGYYGNMVYIGWLKSNGDVIIRLSGYADHYNFSSGSPVVISWTYITA